MPTDPYAFALEMIDKLEAALRDQQAGVVSVSSPSGESVTYSRKQALDELAHWHRQAETARRGKLNRIVVND